MIDIADGYSYIARTLFLSAWYASVAPLGVIFSLTGLFLNYWVDKWLMLRIHSAPENVSEEIFTGIINIIEALPLIYICGNIEYELRITVSANLIKFVVDFFSMGATSLGLFLGVLSYVLFFRKKSVEQHAGSVA